MNDVLFISPIACYNFVINQGKKFYLETKTWFKDKLFKWFELFTKKQTNKRTNKQKTMNLSSEVQFQQVI